MEKIVKDYAGSVKLVVKFYPYKYRDYARISAEAALAASDQGKFREMHLLLLKKSPDLNRNDLIEYAKEVGLDVDRFISALNTHKNMATIDRDVKLAQDIDLYNTPTFFINGRKIIGNVPFSYLKKIIEEELRAQKK